MDVTARRRPALVLMTAPLAAFPAVVVAGAPAVGADLEEIVVTGSRIQQRFDDVPLPVILISREDIDRASQDSIGKVLQQMPMVTGSPANTNVNLGGDGSVRIDLRGLGAERSLVLVNGRRFVYGGVGADTSSDVNMIPMSMLERVEVLGVGSSTVYGSDAIGGVVNFITREDYQGAELTGSYTVTGENDGDVYDIRFFAGETWTNGYLTFGGELVHQNDVFMAARDYSKSTEYLRADGTIGTSGSPVTPQGRFAIPDGNALGLQAGAYTRVDGSGNPPTAADFRPFVAPDDFYDFAPINYLQTPSDRQYLWLLGGYEFSPALTLFGEALLHHRESQQLLAPTPFSTRFGDGSSPVLANGAPGIPADNYYNVFRVDLSRPNGVARRFTESVGRRATQYVDTERYVGGLRGELSATWQWELSATFGRNDADVATEGEFRNDHLVLAVDSSGQDADGNIVCGKPDPATGIVPPDRIIPGCVPLNLFGGQGPDGRGTITPEQLDYVTKDLEDHGYNEQQIYELVFRGDWGAVQDRPIRWAVGATHRVESAANRLDPARLDGTAGGSVTNINDGGQVTANEAYAETALPLLNGMPGAEALNLTAGARFSDFSSFGSVTTYQGGILYRPVREVTLRAGYGGVFRAPPVANLFESRALVPDDFTADPCGNNPTPEQQIHCAEDGVPGGSYVQDSALPVVVGGNVDLEPEEGNSMSAGMTLTSEFAPGLAFSVDYWRTRIDNVISLQPDYAVFLQDCADTGNPIPCAKVQRNTDGSVFRIDGSHTNLARLETSGLDFDLGYTTPIRSGRLGSRIMATYTYTYDATFYEGAQTRELAGTMAPFGALPTWRGLGYLEYEQDGWSGSYQLQYIGSMEECIDEPLESDAFVGCRTIDDTLYQDLRLSYTFDNGPELSLAILNLADVDPPRIATGNGANTDPATYPLLGRTYFASFTYRIE